MSHAAYEKIGEVKGALAKYADEKYGELLNFAKPEQVRRIFIQLVRPGEGTEDNTRRLATKADLGETSWSLVKQLADARLVITSRNAINQETVEVVHEALIQNWRQLQEWMKEDHLFRAWQEQLRAARRRWEATQRDEGALQRGALLAESQNWLQERQSDLSSADQNYINLSLALKKQELEKHEQELTDRAEQAESKLRWLFAGLVIAVIVAVVTIGLFWQVGKANDNIFAHSLLDRAEVTRKGCVAKTREVIS